MYNNIIKIIKKIKIYFLLKKKNKFFFNTNIKNKDNKIILIEYNSFHGSHLCQALFSNFLKRKNSGKIVAYFNYTLMVSPLKINYLQKFKWYLSSFLSLGFKGIYRSFGVDQFIRPKILSKFSHIAELETKKFFKKKPNNNKIVNYKIKNIWIGDLLYDTYLKSKLQPTINIKDREFYFFFKEFLELFLYWDDFFKKNNVVSTIGVSPCYSFGIPLRVSTYNKIPSYLISTMGVMKVDKNVPNGYFLGKYYKKIFSTYLKKHKQKCLKIAKDNLNLRLDGHSGLKVGLYNRKKSSFAKTNNKTKVLLNNFKIKILISTHDFLDSAHVNGKNFFPDFYLWISYLGKLSEKKSNEYDFYIKNHPNFGNKYNRYQTHTEITVNELIKKYPKIKKIPNETSHKQIIREGINVVLTVFGSVGVEYAALGIPVINASVNNPHINYNFNIHPTNLKEYKKTLNNLHKIKLKIKKEEIYESYFMRHFFWDESWLFDDYNKFMQKVGGFDGIHSDLFYEYWLNYFKIEDLEKSLTRFQKFIDSKNYRLSIFDSDKVKTILKL
jgi:hypothetical protein